MLNRFDLIAYSIFALTIGILTTFGTESLPPTAISKVFGAFFFLLSLIAVIGLTVASDWFQRLIGRSRRTRATEVEDL